VQAAKELGAEVTGGCSTRNVAMVRSIGADHLIDHTREDFTRSEQRYDDQVIGTGAATSTTGNSTIVLTCSGGVSGSLR
jgi:NADPH:quinone reductase-like Zn-dependent oxidoreductase